MKKVTTAATIAVLITVAGCASSDNANQQLNTLSNKVDKLTMEVSKLKAQQEKSNQAIERLEKANKMTKKKLNNISSSYKK